MRNSHLCKEDYEEIKERVGMRQVAEAYGYPVNDRGLCRCPFHDDRSPSMKIYPDGRGYYCFACGTGGDVIKFVGSLFGLKNEEAARRLIEDFHLPIQTENLTYQQKRERDLRERERRKLDDFRREAYEILSEYRKLLCEARQSYADPHFEEALRELTIVEYRLECLKECPREYYADRKAVRRLGEIERRIAGWYDRDSEG